MAGVAGQRASAGIRAPGRWWGVQTAGGGRRTARLCPIHPSLSVAMYGFVERVGRLTHPRTLCAAHGWATCASSPGRGPSFDAEEAGHIAEPHT